MTRGSITRLGCFAALLLAVLAAPALARAGGGKPAAPHQGHRGVQVAGKRPRAMAAVVTGSPSSGTADIPGDLISHGGPVMASNSVHAMYWFPPGYSLSSTWRSTVDGFFGAVAADKGKTSNVFSAAAQYGATYNAQFLGSAIDTTPFPTSGCTQGLPGKPCLTEEQVFNELEAFAARQNWAADANSVSGSSPVASTHPTHLFVVYLPPGVADCFDASQGICSADSTKPYYCAYHTAWLDDNQTFVWANMPYSWDDSGCQGAEFPNSQAADAAIDVTSHEYIEALTDPYLDAWYDDQGYEIADKCQSTYGTALDPVSGNYNQLISSGHYWTQLEYSNNKHDCYQLGAPVISSTTPTAALPGATVAIGGQNFFGPVVVKFNGLVAEVQTVTPTQITVKVPSGNFFGKISVQALGGSVTSSATFGFPAPHVTTLAPADGMTGTELTITGTNLDGATSVKFGATPDPTFVVADDGLSITAHVPAGFSSGHVVVVGPGGVATSTQLFQVTKVTSFTPATAKAGATITISGQGLASAATVDFPNHAGAPVTQPTASAIHVVVPVDATAGPLVVHTPNIGVDGIATNAFSAIPTIASFTPDGSAGSTVTIAGANLSDATAVKFGSVVQPATPDPSGTSVTATAPAGFASGLLTVVTPHGSAVSKTAFAITKVTALTPTSAPFGALVTITGQGLKSTTSIDFPGAPGIAPFSTAPTMVTVKVPAAAGIGALVIHTPNISPDGYATKSFKPLPRISGFETSGNQVGSTITAHGTNLAETGSATAKIGAVTLANVVVADSTTVTFDLPANAVTGALTFTNAGGTTTSTALVTIRPTISGAPSPAHAASGKKVTLSGATFTGTKSVSFGGAKAAFTVGAGGTTLTATVPAAATTGPITVTNAGGSTDSVDFQVDPAITSFTPLSAAVGATITVSGTGLKGVSAVDFGGGVSASPTSTTPTSLKVVVPAGATPGPISVHAGSLAASSAKPFAVTLSVTGFSQDFGIPGHTITIYGVGLTGITGVTFGGLSAAIASQSGTSLQAVVPAIAGSSAVLVKKGTTTVAAPGMFGLFAVTAALPGPVTAGGSVRIDGSGLTGATATFAGAPTPAALVASGPGYSTATVPTGFTGGQITITDIYGDAIDESLPLFAIDHYSAAHAAPGDSITIQLASSADYSSADVHVRFPGAADVEGVGGNGSVTVDIPASATSGAISVDIDGPSAGGASGWATGTDFTVDRATLEINEVGAGAVELKALTDGGVGGTRVTVGGTTLTLASSTVAAGAILVVPFDGDTAPTGNTTVFVDAPGLGPEDGLALADGTTDGSFDAMVAALEDAGVWSGAPFDWSSATAGQTAGRVTADTPDSAANWAVGDSTLGSGNS